MPTSARLLLLTALLIATLAVAWPMFGLGATTPPLLTQHAQPAVYLPAQIVAVVNGGKTFHDPKCTALHGRAHMVTAEEATREGYVPCVRCMRRTLEKR